MEGGGITHRFEDACRGGREAATQEPAPLPPNLQFGLAPPPSIAPKPPRRVRASSEMLLQKWLVCVPGSIPSLDFTP